MNPSQNVPSAAFNCPNCGAAAAPDSVRCPYCNSSIATHICSSCFGVVAFGMNHCPSCGAGTEGGTPEMVAMLQCPRCRTPLSLVTVGGHKLHECLGCGGLWVGVTDFQKICARQEDQEAILGTQSGAGTSSGSTAHPTQPAYIPCPECGKLMNRKNFAGCSGIVLDWCREHGSWFDRHELQQIVTFIRNGGLRKSRQRELARIQDEKLQLRAQQHTMTALAGHAGLDPAGRLEFPQDPDPFVKILSLLFRDIGRVAYTQRHQVADSSSTRPSGLRALPVSMRIHL